MNFQRNIFILLVLSATLFACSLSHRPPSDGAPRRAPNLAQLQDAVPKPEAKSRYGNHSPYQVLGKTYHVMPTAEGYTEVGLASWYGTKFHGRRTSSWEPYDMYALTAAHKTLPLPTYLRVTNLRNLRTVIVKVNDRGPFHGDRILDLSYGAAYKLGFADEGTTEVKVEAITYHQQAIATRQSPAVLPEQTVSPQSTVTSKIHPDAPAKPSVYLQAGAFQSRNTANHLLTRLQAITSLPISIKTDTQGLNLHRVLVGPLASKQQALVLTQVIKNQQIADPLLVWR